MIKKLTLLTLLFCFAFLTKAQDYQWAHGFGVSGSESGKSTVADDSGNVYITGQFSAPVDFDPSGATAMLSNGGIFLAKYDASGSYLWGLDLSPGITNSVALDNMGNVFVSGYFHDTVDFDPSGNTANLASEGVGGDIFLAKYNPSGNYLWAIKMGGKTHDEAYSVALDGSGNAYVTGEFRDTADFDPSGNTANLRADSLTDIFLAKYDAAGDYLWAGNMGGKGEDIGNSVAIDNTGNVFVTGYFHDTVDFDPSGAAANLNSAGYSDVFLAKYNPSGNYKWAIGMGGDAYGGDEGASVSVDGSGNAYVTGHFVDNADFDPSGATANLTAANNSNDAFLAKYDASGNYRWAINMGGPDFDMASSLGLDGSGNVFVIGGFEGTADFDPSSSTANFSSEGDNDIFLAKYDLSGNYLWANGIGGKKPEFGSSVTLNGNGSVYVTGSFRNTVDFDPSGTTANLTSAGETDIFLAKYSVSGATGTVLSENEINSKAAIYPNPNPGQFTINWQGMAVEKIQVFNLAGEQVASSRAAQFTRFQSSEHTMSISDIPKGIYFVKLRGKNASLVRKMVIR